MMDDIFFDSPAICTACHKIYESGIMVWLDGECLCPDCYTKRINRIDGKGNNII